MFRFVIAGFVLLTGLFGAALAAVPESKLAQPPADAERWVAVWEDQEFGFSARWTDKDGTRWSRQSVMFNGEKREIDQQIRLSADGQLQSLEIRGVALEGDAAEHFSVTQGAHVFSSRVDTGAGAMRRDLFYAAFSGTLDAQIMLFDAARKGTIDLVPSGRLRLEQLTSAKVTDGRTTRTLTAYLATGLDFSPQPVWYDGERFFGIVDFLSYVPQGWAKAVPVLREAQDAALLARVPDLVARLAPRLSGAVAFRNVRLYDADARAFRQGMTVVVADGKIAAVGPASSTHAPVGATTIEGDGKTLIPGLWDSHHHYDAASGTRGTMLLSQGITSIREPGNQPDLLMAGKKRIDDGISLGPRIVPSLMIDGPGPSSVPIAIKVSTQKEAFAAVDLAKARGYAAIKIYGSLKARLVKPTATRAHRLGLRVHGHIPQGMRPFEAIGAGFDEITHINFVVMQAMPDAVVNASANRLQRFYGPGRYAAGVDLKGPVMTSLLDEMAARGTVVDPTLATFERILVDKAGALGASRSAFEGTLPPEVERDFRTAKPPAPADLSPAVMSSSFDKFKALVFELHRRGIPILAGTDGMGLELVRDLELYVEAGLSEAEALATATIVPAKAFGLEAETGSLAVGKKAELALIDGDPSTRIGDLRQVELVMRDGRLMKAEDLRAAIGITGMPKRQAQ